MAELAIVIKKTGSPKVLEESEITLRDIQNDEVVIKHTAIGLNYRDVYQRKGDLQVKLPFIPGCEATGIIEAVAERNLTNFKVGERVVYCTALGGAYSTKRIIKAKYLIKLPSTISNEVAAATFFKGMIAHALLHRVFLVNQTSTILVQDAASDIGQIICQWARTLKCKIIGSLTAPGDENIALSNGCDIAIQHNDPNFKENINAFTEQKGVNVVYDCLGSAEVTKLSISCLRTFGLYALYEEKLGAAPPINYSTLKARSLFFTAPNIFQYKKDRVEFAFTAAEILSRLQDGRLNPQIYKRFNLSQIQTAHQELESNSFKGSAIITF